MGYLLITGASGLIGRAAVATLAPGRPVLAMGRHLPDVPGRSLSGSFADPAALDRLAAYDITAVLHLGAVTGGCSEADGLAVNVEGTRRLLRALADRGCRRFVLASSIAAVGFAHPAFRPVQVPLPDDHPCLARDAYGLSKALMEQVAGYFARQQDDIDILCLRLATVADDDHLPPQRGPGPLGAWSLGGITVLARSDAVRLCRLALDAPPRPGLRIRNAVGPRAWVAAPVAEILRGWYGPALDLGHYAQAGRAYDAVFAPGRLAAELGFVARRLPVGQPALR